MAVIEVKSKEDLDQRKATDALVVIDFYATWCGPCKMMAPKVEELSNKYTSVVFLKIDVDELTEVAQEYKITAMPTFRLYKGGKEIVEIVGANYTKLEQAVQANN